MVQLHYLLGVCDNTYIKLSRGVVKSLSTRDWLSIANTGIV